MSNIQYTDGRKVDWSPQNFSSQDKSKSLNNLGVVFPFDEAEDDKPIFSGIMITNKKRNVIAHFEYRTATGKLSDNLVYTESRCAALVSKPSTTPSFVASMFGAQSKSNNYSALKSCKTNNYFDEVQTAFDQMNFTAFTDTVIAENVIPKPTTIFRSQNHNQWNNNSWNQNQNSINNSFDILEPLVTLSDYNDASLVLNNLAEFNALTTKELDSLTMTSLLDYYESWYTAAYGHSSSIIREELSDLSADKAKDELVLKTVYLQDFINQTIIDVTEIRDLYLNQSKPKEQSKQSIIGISLEEYTMAKEELDKLKDFKAIPFLEIDDVKLDDLLAYYDRWHKATYGREDKKLYEQLKGMKKDDIQEELVFETLALIDTIEASISEAKDTIDLYTRENKPAIQSISGAERFDIIHELCRHGFSKGAMLTKTNDELLTLYDISNNNKPGAA